MTVKVSAAFTGGTDGDDLDTYTPDIDVEGGGFLIGAANSVELDGSGEVKCAASLSSARIDIGSADGEASVDYRGGGSDNRATASIRSNHSAGVDASGLTYYGVNIRQAVNQIHILKRTGSTTVSLGSGSPTLNSTTTYNIKVQANGTAIEIWLDGVSKATATDSTITTGNYAGFNHSKYTDGNGRFDNFLADDLAAGGVTIPVFMNHYRNQGAA